MTFLFWAAAIVVFAIAEAATTALVSIWFAVGAAAAMVASIFTASLGVQCAVFAVVSAVTLVVMLPLLAKRRTMRQPPITNGSPLTIGSRGIVLRAVPQPVREQRIRSVPRRPRFLLRSVHLLAAECRPPCGPANPAHPHARGRYPPAGFPAEQCRGCRW